MDQIIKKLTNSIEEYLTNKIICNLKFPNDSPKINCNFLGPHSVTINNILKIDYHLSGIFKATFSEIEFYGTEKKIKFNHISRDEEDLNYNIFNFFFNEFPIINLEVNKTIISFFEIYFNDFRTYVEENIDEIISDNVTYSGFSDFEEIKTIYQIFKKPDFIINKIDEGKVFHIYKRGEGFKECVSGKKKFEFKKLDYSFCQNKEKNVKLFLEEKSRSYHYSENGHDFSKSKNDDHKFRNEEIDIDMTRLLINTNNFESRDHEYDKFLLKKYEELNKTLTKNELYFILYILFCDIKEYLVVIKPQKTNNNYTLNMYEYYYILYSIYFKLTDIHYNSPLTFEGHFIFSKHYYEYHKNISINELPQFDFIIDKVTNCFKNSSLDEYFNAFLINSCNVEYNLNNLIRTLYTFFVTKFNA